MRFVKDYMKDNVLRKELNELTQETFGFDFESWVINGYDTGDYIPYSFEENGMIISNVSINHMEFVLNEIQERYIQLGTVMTKQAYRKQGLAKQLMEKVLTDYLGKCDGIYLFSNLDALDLYNKIGFKTCLQYKYILRKEIQSEVQQMLYQNRKDDYFHPVSKDEEGVLEQYIEMVKQSNINASLDQNIS